MGAFYVTGRFADTVDFGKGPLTSVGVSDIFVASYDSSGQARWTKTFGSPLTDEAYAITSDTSDNVIVTGYFSNTITPGAGSLTSKGSYDAFVVSYDTSGKNRWNARLGGSGECRGRSVAVNKSGDIFVTGSFLGNFGTLVGHGGLDVFLVRMAP